MVTMKAGLSPGVLLAAVCSLLVYSGCGPVASTAPAASPVTAASPIGTPQAVAHAAATRHDPSPRSAGTLIPRSAPVQMTVEEYPIVSSDAASPTVVEYWKRIDPAILEKRKEWRETPLQAIMPEANQTLETFGYRLGKTEQPGCPICVSFKLFRGKELVLDDLSHFLLPVLNERGDDFLMIVEGKRGENHLVRKSGTTPWKPEEHAFLPPRYLEGQPLSVWSPGLNRYELRKGDTILHAGTVASPRVDNPFKSLWVWGSRWALEIDGELLVDGKSLNVEMGYEEVFGSQLLRDEPFYFFKTGGSVGMSYAGQELAQRYDEVVHYRCCEPAAFNLHGNNNMVWFHARRDGTWYYVEAGSYLASGAEPGTAAPGTR